MLPNIGIQILEHALAATHVSPYSAGRRIRVMAFGQLLPLTRFDSQLSPALRRQPVEIRLPVVFGCARFKINPSAFDQPVQGRI